MSVRPRLTLAFALVATAGVLLSLAPAFAQSPFGVGTPPAPAESGGIAAFILAKQAEFYRLLTAAVRASKQDGSAIFLLGGISFAYGVFHAAGPGHGKAVISSYLLANEATWKRGVGLAFASAFAQGATAILVAGLFAVILGATAATMSRAVTIIEIVAYGLIVLIGARLAWIKGRALFHAWRGTPAHLHGPNCDCGDDHSHMPGPDALPRTANWRDWWGAVLSVGLRPCTGAILVLVFALTQGIFWVGAASTLLMSIGTAITVSVIAAIAVFAKHAAVRIAATRPGSASAITLLAVELAAALALTAFGLALLTGFMASERLGI